MSNENLNQQELLAAMQLGEIKPEVLAECAAEMEAQMKVAPKNRVNKDQVKAEAEEANMGTNRSIYLGTFRLPDETRLHKHGTFDYRLETRQCEIDVYVDVSHPDLNDFFNAVKACAKAAAITAVIVAVATESSAIGLRIFYPLFIECLAQKISEEVARQVDVQLRAEKSCNNWSGH